jgi:hypothetical protein
VAGHRRDVADWKDFEQFVARIEKDARSIRFVFTSPRRILCKITGRKRKVDASIRSRAGTTNILTTIECGKRLPHAGRDVDRAARRENRMLSGRRAPVRWVPQDFMPNEVAVAGRRGIQLRRLSEASAATIKSLMRSISFSSRLSARLPPSAQP